MIITRGTTWTRVLRFRTGATPIDLTGSTFTAGVYRPSRELLHTIVPNVSAAAGDVELEIADEDTVNLPYATNLRLICLWEKANGEKAIVLDEECQVARGVS